MMVVQRILCQAYFSTSGEVVNSRGSCKASNGVLSRNQNDSSDELFESNLRGQSNQLSWSLNRASSPAPLSASAAVRGRPWLRRRLPHHRHARMAHGRHAGMARRHSRMAMRHPRMAMRHPRVARRHARRTGKARVPEIAEVLVRVRIAWSTEKPKKQKT